MRSSTTYSKEKIFKLVIHPKDSTTDFLKPIYQDLDCTVITGGVDRHSLKTLIDESEQVIMMGHGSPYGLMSVGQFNDYGNIINDSCAEALAEKDNSVFIWCNADSFVKFHGLNGFSTGMFVSEASEAKFCGMPLATQRTVDQSNEAFVESMRRVIDCEPEMMHSYMKQAYADLARINPVAKYNHERLYLFQGVEPTSRVRYNNGFFGNFGENNGKRRVKAIPHRAWSVNGSGWSGGSNTNASYSDREQGCYLAPATGYRSEIHEGRSATEAEKEYQDYCSSISGDW